MQNCTSGLEAYGSHRVVSMDGVKPHDPHLVNPDLMLPGQKIVLPEYQKNKG